MAIVMKAAWFEIHVGGLDCVFAAVKLGAASFLFPKSFSFLAMRVG